MDRWQAGSLSVLYVLVIVLALTVVANRHYARQLFVDFQQLEKKRDELNANWSRLTLEYSTRLNQVYVERSAKRELGMQKPSADKIRIVRE
ncbi:MAG: cell division protein FtsL [Thiolinea sp.]